MMVKTNKSLIYFIIITFAFSWLLWLGPMLDSAGYSIPTIFLILGMFANFGPTVAAIIITAKSEKSKGVIKLLKLGINWKFKKIWLVPILILPIFISFLSVLFVIFIQNEHPFTYGVSLAMWIPTYFMMYFMGGPIAEEFGWRGFALDKFQQKYNATISSIILGIIWSIWHLPLFFIAGSTQSYIPIYEFIVMTTTVSIIYTWIQNNTRSKDGSPSVFAAILLHNSFNFASATIPYWITDFGRWIGWIITLVYVVIIILIYGYKNLKRKRDRKT